MASAPSISACKLIKGDWSSGMYECSVLSCAWKTPRVLTGALATTSNNYEDRRSRRRASSNFTNIMNTWRCENNNLEKLNDSKAFNFTLSRRHVRSHHAFTSNKKWKLFSTSFLEPFDEVSPDSLWEDLKPSISYLAPKELILVNDALKFAFKAHNGQKRRSGEPFIIHPVEVARILGELELDWESIAAGLLHDTVEDTSVTFEMIEKEFGSTVRHIVEGETKVSKLGKLKCKDTDDSVQDVKADDLRQMFLAMTEEVRVIIVKLADRLHNMRTLSHMPQHKQSSIALETLQVFAPLAKLLGMYRIKSELEYLSFMYTNPKDFSELKKRVDDLYKEHEKELMEAKKILMQKIENDQFLELVTVKTEVRTVCKDLYSIYRTMVKSKSSIKEVNQIAQLRIIIKPKTCIGVGPLCNAQQICYHVFGLVHGIWTPIPRAMKDYIATPKPNGYQSLHTTVIPFLYESMFRLEVQIRTEDMDLIAERGIAAHYNGRGDASDMVGYVLPNGSAKAKTMCLNNTDIALRIGWLNAIREWQEEFVGNMSSREFVDTVMRDLLGSRIFVFTPKGEIKNLPKGATAIDYAYLIHTEIGNKMVAAKVNGNLVSPMHVLANAEVVEILTYNMAQNEQQPSLNEAYDPSKDPKRKAKSTDIGWKYGFWPDLNKKDVVQCILCNKQMHSGVRRLKQHLAGGYADVAICPKTTPEIRKEMKEYIGKHVKKSVPLDDVDDDVDIDDEHHEAHENEASTGASNTMPSSGTTLKRKKMAFMVPQSKPTKSIASMLRKTPEEVIEERHSKGPSQTTLEGSTKTEEEKNRVKMHIANFFYECGIPFNAAHSRSYEIMVESIGQFGPGLKPPTYHELRLPLLEKAKNETNKLREKHEKAWKQYGCTLMSDGWTDKRGRHLINFLVNSPEGTFFLKSVDVSSKVQDAGMLAALFEEQIDLIGRDIVIQVVTDNGANFKAAGGLLCQRIPTLYWTPCAAHCLDLMLEDITKLKEFDATITQGRGITTFVYRHGRLLSAMREKTSGKDLVRPGATRFATAFLTLQSLYKNRDALRKLFGGEEWFNSKLAKTIAGGKVHDFVLSTRFWNNVEDCIRASQPLLVVLRIVDGDEKPGMAEIGAAMDYAKSKIKDALEKKPRLANKVLSIIERRWESQMEVDLYGAALFLNPGRFFDIKEDDLAYSSRLRMKFNDVLERMVLDTSMVEKISDQADQYENSRNSFGKQLSIRQRKTKNPLDWWGAFGGHTIELTMFAKRIVGLCCSSSGCERNWSTFEFIHTKRRNRLEHQRLNDLVYVQYNRKITTRFQKRREEGKNFDPLILDDFQWDNEWINGEVVDSDDVDWLAVDRALDASEGIDGRRNPSRGGGNDIALPLTYSRRRGSGFSSHVNASSNIDIVHMEQERIILNDDEDVDDDYGHTTDETPTHETGDCEANDEVELDDYL